MRWRSQTVPLYSTTAASAAACYCRGNSISRAMFRSTCHAGLSRHCRRQRGCVTEGGNDEAQCVNSGVALQKETAHPLKKSPETREWQLGYGDEPTGYLTRRQTGAPHITVPQVHPLRNQRSRRGSYPRCGSDSRYAVTARASRGRSRKAGMGGRAFLPSGFNPVSRKWIICAGVQPLGKPAMAGALAAQPGMGWIGRKAMSAPCSRREAESRPEAGPGVWQSPHIPTWFTR